MDRTLNNTSAKPTKSTKHVCMDLFAVAWSAGSYTAIYLVNAYNAPHARELVRDQAAESMHLQDTPGRITIHEARMINDRVAIQPDGTRRYIRVSYDADV